MEFQVIIYWFFLWVQVQNGNRLVAIPSAILAVRINTEQLLRVFLCYLSGMIRFLRFVCVFWAFSTNAQTIQNNFIAGKTTGILPFLEYGLGIDRLGGAKMTYLDTGVTIKVVDSTIVNYKVQLSKDHFAYLPKQNFQRENIT